MTLVILFVFGLCVGSFLHVLALRHNSGASLGGRSACSVCATRLRWYELVPVLSFLFLSGRCRTCRSKISWRYPAVEVLTGLLFATVPLVFLPVFSLYIAITLYDLRHKIIPDALVYAAIALSALTRAFLGGGALDYLAGPILFLFFAAIWLLSRGRAIGFGDSKLALSIGLLLGAAGGFSAVILAFWIGAVWGIGAMIFSPKRLTMKSELPFAPFLILGAWLSAAFAPDLLHVSTLFQ